MDGNAANEGFMTTTMDGLLSRRQSPRRLDAELDPIRKTSECSVKEAYHEPWANPMWQTASRFHDEFKIAWMRKMK